MKVEFREDNDIETYFLLFSHYTRTDYITQRICRRFEDLFFNRRSIIINHDLNSVLVLLEFERLEKILRFTTFFGDVDDDFFDKSIKFIKRLTIPRRPTHI